MPETGWLQTIEFGSLTVLEAKSPKSRYQQGWAPSKDSREGFFLAGVYWHSLVFLCRYVTAASASVFT